MNTEDRALPLTTGKVTSSGDSLYWLPVLFDGDVIAEYTSDDEVGSGYQPGPEITVDWAWLRIPDGCDGNERETSALVRERAAEGLTSQDIEAGRDRIHGLRELKAKWGDSSGEYSRQIAVITSIIESGA